jgi:hypothetical protein
LPHETPETLEASVTRLAETPVDIINFQPLNLVQSAYGKSEIWSNPDFYGYTVIDDPYIPGKQTWKNEIWDQETCRQLAWDYEKRYVESGRMRLGGTVGAFGMINLGYDFLETTKMTIKEFRSEEMVEETKKNNSYKATTFDPQAIKDSELYQIAKKFDLDADSLFENPIKYMHEWKRIGLYLGLSDLISGGEIVFHNLKIAISNELICGIK